MPYLDLCKEAKVALSLVQMVMLQQKVEEACVAHEAQAMFGHPTNRDFLGMVRYGMIVNCPVSPTAMLNANRIFGPDFAGVRG
jgi:hypothetical protein